MNNFKKISAVILALCTVATVLYSCDNSKNTYVTSTTPNSVEITEIITEKETVTVEVTDEKGNVSVSVSEKIITVPVTKNLTTVKNDKTENKPEEEQKNTVVNKISSVINQLTTVATLQNQQKPSATDKPVSTAIKTTSAHVRTSVAATKRPVVDDKINEKSVGIFLLSKTDPVQIGNQANIIIQGTPGKTYSISFYETPTSVSGLEDMKADANGFVIWTFEISSACNLGKRKVVIKENNSDNYIETSITVR